MFKNVLFAVDLTEPGSWKRALPAAIEACRPSGATLTIVTVNPEISSQLAPYFPADAQHKLHESVTKALAEFAAKNVPAEIKTRTAVLQGNIYRQILAAAETAKADLIVMAAHKHGMRDIIMGANADQVVRHFDQSVLVVRG